jgi:hypothetical protein
MPETPLSREQLLCSVLVLEPGDLLILRVTRPHLSAKEADEWRRLAEARVAGMGVRVLVLAHDVEPVVYRAEPVVGR